MCLEQNMLDENFELANIYYYFNLNIAICKSKWVCDISTHVHRRVEGVTRRRIKQYIYFPKTIFNILKNVSFIINIFLIKFYNENRLKLNAN